MFGPFNGKWRVVLEHARLTYGANWPTIPKAEFPCLLAMTMDRMKHTVPQLLASGFRTCGIYPCDVRPLLDKVGSEQAKELDAELIGSCLKEYLEERDAKLQEQSEANKRKSVSRKKVKTTVPGQCVSAEEVAYMIAAEEAEKAKKAQPQKRGVYSIIWLILL